MMLMVCRSDVVRQTVQQERIMLFSSLTFLYLFLPLLILVYFLSPKPLRNLVLLLFSLVFYGWGEPKYLALILVSISAGYLSGLVLSKIKNKSHSRMAAAAFVVVILGMLAYFKYADFVISTVNGVFHADIPLLRLALPIGISFYTFQILSYTIDVYRGQTEVQKNPIDFAAYVVLFPQLIAGPIVRYRDIAAELRHRQCGIDMACSGAQRFVIGLGKKVLLANQLGILVEAYYSSAEPTVLFAWLAAIAYLFQIYLDFSGYSDMAIGLGRIFGFHFPENFNYPFLSVSVTEFWRRWHMTLGAWFRDYVYIPLGGNRVKKLRWLFNILVVWCLTGLWHGAGWNFLLWGLFFAVLLMIEKLWILKFLERRRWFGHIYVILALLFSFVLFRSNSMTQFTADLRAMLQPGNLPGFNTESLYHLRSSLGLLVLSAVASTPLGGLVAKELDNSRFASVLAWTKPFLLAALLVLCTAFLVDGSFNPFLYFRF